MNIKYFNHVFLALLSHVFLMVFLGAGLLRSSLVFMIDRNYSGIFSSDEIYEEIGILHSIPAILAKAFLPGWEIFLAPIVALFICAWLHICFRERKLKIFMTTKERRTCVRLTYLVPLTFLAIAIAKLPSDILFSGPIYGYHPISPALRMLCAILLPAFFWYCLDQFGQKDEGR